MKFMTGNETFDFNNKSAGFNMLDFWQFEFSNIYDMQDEISEFIVAMALEIDVPYNKELWTLYDIYYKKMRIEVKETSYYHPWNVEGKVSKQRTFGITMANSSYEDKDHPNKYERQNDIYVFCVVNGETRENANPLNLNNWDFYVIPTFVINEKCKKNKTISLNRIHSLGYKPIQYDELKSEIDKVIENCMSKKENYYFD